MAAEALKKTATAMGHDGRRGSAVYRRDR
ncbi:MAG: hypothetical protein P8Y03_12750 [Anaerolineales bacterium]